MKLVSICFPFSSTLLIYTFFFGLLARMVNVFPLANFTTAFSNKGLVNANSLLPGHTEYIPRLDNIYHADICPQSSLPMMPSGVGLYIS